MADNKKTDNKKPEAIEPIRLESFNDWTKQVKQDITFERPNGESYIFTIFSLDANFVENTTKEHRKLLPIKPERRKLPNGKPDMGDGFYDNAVKKYEQALTENEKIMMYKYIVKGLIDPNGWTLPGDNEKEKMENLNRVVAGDLSKLFFAISKLSNLGINDLTFF